MIRRLVVSALFALSFAAAAVAGDYGTRAEAVAMVERAVALYEAEGKDALAAAVADKDNADFHDRDLYVFFIGLDGIYVSHGVNPTLVGRDLRGIRDASGDYFGLRMIDAAARAEPAWVDYVWANPVTGQEEWKSSYVAGIGGQWFVGVGVYLDHQG